MPRLKRLSPAEIEALDQAGELDHILPDFRPLAVEQEQLIYDPVNARGHDDKNLESVDGSMALYQQRVALVVNSNTCVVEKGNGTLQVARKQKWKYIAVAGADDTPLQATGFALADNRTAELAHWNYAVLSPQLEALGAEGLDLGSIGFDPTDCEEALKAFQDLDPLAQAEDGDEDSDSSSDGAKLAKAGVVMQEPAHQVKRGDVWQMGHHTLICCDVLTQWDQFLPYLQGDVVFAPYPGVFLMLTTEASERPFVLAQPDAYIAGHMLDQWDKWKGDGHAKCIKSS